MSFDVSIRQLLSVEKLSPFAFNLQQEQRMKESACYKKANKT
jgi:hypothetical protein